MKWLFLFCFTLILLFSFTGCGLMGKYDVSISTKVPAQSDIKGINEAQFVNYVDVTVNKSTLKNLKVKSLEYSISNNIGGSGRISVNIMDLGKACDITIPLVVIPVIANKNIGDTPLKAGFLIDKINERLYTGGRICLQINQDDITNPINLRFKLITTVSADIAN